MSLEVSKPWETREWWEKGIYKKEELEQMETEEMARLEKQPWFEHGKPCRTDIFWKRDWVEERQLIWGRWGQDGIGKLRKVALMKPHEYDMNPIFEREPAYYILRKETERNLDKWRKAHAEYARILESLGVEIVWLEPPESPVGPYGFQRNFCTPGAFSPTKAGMVIMRPARGGAAGDYSMRWITEQCTRMGCPIYHTMIHPWEIYPTYIAENSALIAEGWAASPQGAVEMKGLLEAIGIEVFVGNTPGALDAWGFPAGGTIHLDMAFATVDLGLAVVFPSFLDWRTITYLRSKKVRLIELPAEDYANRGANLLLIEPGKVVIPAQARETIKKLKKEGVECVEVDFSYIGGFSGGPMCTTGKLLRDPGPTLDNLMHQ